ncbi:uncharacterized protein MELLADRAFT_109451 [Melampsora larici-populina 98AG31]|uniref:Uncharacterized protein n=1 Tax=Melampsora larici-populina (strain 98AG31 / pathotype 3-4-7) TaxID=747676 RepID=F4RWI3_MELLP|nr:uncharacterized protein MELLADRAFT_109451 [Melampsora larici-populina 98AG31]EGG03317.1 hypothetical protein MELLADRAFT_109451 [Melampsora larici-populina 98AG31]
MAWWGPMLAVSEFPGERMCGFLQKINTNGKVEEMAQTIMRRFCHQQRLLCKAPPPNDPVKVVQRNVGGLFEMDDMVYGKLLNYHQAQDSAWCDWRVLPYPDGAKVLSAYAREVGVLTCLSGTKYSKKAPSNIVKVEVESKIKWGKILHILMLKDSNEPIVMLRWLEVVRDLALDQMFERLSMVRVIQSAKEEFIPASAVVSTLAHRELPCWTLGMKEPSMLLMGVNPGEHDYVLPEGLDDMQLEGALGEAMDVDIDMG